MKRSGFILATLLLLVFSCKEKNKIQPESPTLTVSTTELSFTADDKSNKLFQVTTTEQWTAKASESWIHLDKTSGSSSSSIAVSVESNEGTNDRTGTISITGAQSATVKVTQAGSDIRTLEPIASTFDGKKRSSTTYQLLIYSFADGDGDGIGDFMGIQNRLDYLNDLGVTALWLSPAHPSSSYHAYDVSDYYSINTLYGGEEAFKSLIAAAHDKGIKIYMDYVLNHSGKDNAWFKEALADPSSPYRDYYFFSSNPSVDYKSFPMLKGTTYNAGEWKSVTAGSPKMTVRKTDEAVKTGSSNWNLWMWKTGSEGEAFRFVDNGDGSYYMVVDISGSVGMLVRKYMNWDNGSKFGYKSGNGKITEGKAMDLAPEGGDMSFTGSGRYRIELTNVATETLYYMGCFSDWMPDLNYGDLSDVENNACFKDLAASADKWINLGVDGFRLDAVKHICGGISSYNMNSNITLLGKWYEHCNATYKAAGHSDNIFMVAEEWDGHGTEKQYYKALTSCFEFDYWPNLRNAVNGSAGNYVATVSGFINDHKAQRSDAVTSLFMTNHDKSSVKKNADNAGVYRAADDLDRDIVKEKQAAAMILTTGGKPFIYQGEELGYWGDATAGDEYIRTPIMWDKAGKDCAKKGVNNKVDNSMLKSSISVEAQDGDVNSLLTVYKTWSRVRNTYPALAEGSMSASPLNGGSVASWYMTSSDGQKMLVIHNCGNAEKKLDVSDSISKPVAILGTVKADRNTLIVSGHSSIVFDLQ